MAEIGHLAIVGLGLIGSSIARAARLYGAARTITAIDRDPGVIERVRALELADHATDNLAEGVGAADLVILCVPVGDGTRSAVLLLVRADERLEQLVLQLAKLEDVLDVAPAPDGRAAFTAVAEFLDAAGEGAA